MPEAKEERPKTKRCPFCAEIIQAQAVKCRYCCEFLDPRFNYTSAPPAFAPMPPDAPAESAAPTAEGDDESKYTFRGGPSLFALSKFLVTATLVFAFAMFLRFYPLHRIIKPTGELTMEQAVAIIGYIHVIGVSLAIATLLIVAYRIADVKSISYEVTPDRVEWKRGVFGRKTDNLDMFRVIDIQRDQSLLDRILGIATITLITRDTSHPEFDFVKVRKHQKLYDIIKEASLAADRKQQVVHIE